jgi:hypothetical protein
MKNVPTIDEIRAAHGGRAPQIVVDEIVAAVRRGDDDNAKAWDRLLRAIEAQEHMNRRAGNSA